MKFVSYKEGKATRLALLVHDIVIDLEHAYHAAKDSVRFTLNSAESDMVRFLRMGEAAMADARLIEQWFTSNRDTVQIGKKLSEVTLVSPIPRPSSMRDGYAFKQHVEAARRNRGVEMIPEFYEIPIFYFTNHQAVFGPGAIPVRELHLGKLDFELECAIVIGKEGRDISAQDADDYVAGYMVMNDWSARELQMQEMKLNLGPAKGKDFATSLGPWMVTRDELASRRIETPNGETYDLEMTAFVNGTKVSEGNVKDMTWTFAQIIERASYGVTLYPGDVIGSGTCGTGCFLELNGSKVYDPAWWLANGDVVECSISMLGTLSNTVELTRP